MRNKLRDVNEAYFLTIVYHARPGLIWFEKALKVDGKSSHLIDVHTLRAFSLSPGD